MEDCPRISLLKSKWEGESGWVLRSSTFFLSIYEHTYSNEKNSAANKIKSTPGESGMSATDAKTDVVGAGGTCTDFLSNKFS